MYAIFGCGCHAEGDIPIVSTCKKHGHGIVVMYPTYVKKNKVEVGSVTVMSGTRTDLHYLEPESFDKIFCYPEHNLLAPIQYLTPNAWLLARIPEFRSYYKALRPGGRVEMLVSPSTLATASYQARIHGFDVVVHSMVEEHFDRDHLFPNSESFFVYKFLLLLHKGTYIPKKVSTQNVLDATGICVGASPYESKCFESPVFRARSATVFCYSNQRFDRVVKECEKQERGP